MYFVVGTYVLILSDCTNAHPSLLPDQRKKKEKKTVELNLPLEGRLSTPLVLIMHADEVISIR